MKVKGAKAVHYDSGPNMTPLVDVVMVILIFLMLAGKFGGAEHYLVSSLPIQSGASGTKAETDKETVSENLEIRVDPSMTDKFVARFGGLEARNGKSASEGLARLYKQMEEAAKGSTKNTQIVISPGRNVKYSALIEVYQSALQAGFEKVGFATAH